MPGRFSLRKRRKQIPAFAGMTSICKAVRFLHTLFRWNDEVLFDGYCLLQCRYFGEPAVTMRAVRFLYTLENENPEAAVRYIGPFSLWKRCNRFPLPRE